MQEGGSGSRRRRSNSSPIIVDAASIATTGGHADPTNGRKKLLMGDPGPEQGVINSPNEARKAVRQRYKNGADNIKLTQLVQLIQVDKTCTHE